MLNAHSPSSIVWNMMVKEQNKEKTCLLKGA